MSLCYLVSSFFVPIMWFLTVLLLVSCTVAQSFVPGSVLVYTSESSTNLVTDVGTTTLQADPTFCPNISTSILTSTVFEPTLTITLNQPTTSTSQSASIIVTNNGFENGTSIPFNTSASTSSISAEVVQGGPYQPRTGDDYLYVFSMTDQYSTLILRLV